MGQDQFIGTWNLISFKFVRSNGMVTQPLGHDPIGMIMYDASGHMSGHVMRRERPRFSSGDPLIGSAEEIQIAFAGYIAYCGTYVVNVKEKTISHILECSLLPNWVGTTQTRFFEFSGTQLTLTTPQGLFAGQEQIVQALWDRMA